MGLPVIFAIASIMLLVERYQVCETKAIMCCDEVDRVQWLSGASPLLAVSTAPPVTLAGIRGEYLRGAAEGRGKFLGPKTLGSLN